MVIVPFVGWSRHPMMFMRVDFPEPEGPMMAVKAPLWTVSDTPRRAGTWTSFPRK